MLRLIKLLLQLRAPSRPQLPAPPLATAPNDPGDPRTNRGGRVVITQPINGS